MKSRLFGAAVMVACLVALIFSAAAGCQARSYARCQSMVYEQLVRATSARAEAANQDRAADRDEAAATAKLIRDVFGSTSREQSLAAYAAYRATLEAIEARRATADKQRQANPLPAPPSQTCG